MKEFHKFDEVVVGDVFKRVIDPLRKDMKKKGIKTFQHKSFKIINSKMGLAFTDGIGEVLYLNNSTAIMDENMANTSVGKIEAQIYSLHKLICA